LRKIAPGASRGVCGRHAVLRRSTARPVANNRDSTGKPVVVNKKTPLMAIYG
jgi:hypothetical protein